MQDLQSDSNDIDVASVQSCLDRDNKLRDDGEDLSATVLEHIKDTLNCEETIRIHLFANTLKEDRQVVMIIKLLDLNLPLDLVLGAVLNGDREISTVVEETELADGNLTSHDGSGSRLLNWWLFLVLEKGRALATEAVTLLQDC